MPQTNGRLDARLDYILRVYEKAQSPIQRVIRMVMPEDYTFGTLDKQIDPSKLIAFIKQKGFIFLDNYPDCLHHFATKKAHAFLRDFVGMYPAITGLCEFTTKTVYVEKQDTSPVHFICCLIHESAHMLSDVPDLEKVKSFSEGMKLASTREMEAIAYLSVYAVASELGVMGIENATISGMLLYNITPEELLRVREQVKRIAGELLSVLE